MSTTSTLAFSCLLACALAPRRAPAQDPPGPTGLAGPAGPAAQALERSFREQGLELALEGGFVALPAFVQVREDYLEYYLVGRAGATHESLFMTEIKGSLLATALSALGAEQGRNADWTPKDPQPSDEELARGVNPYDVRLPTGTSYFLYAAWREGNELYFHRGEDLVRDLSSGRSMQRHPFVFLGSKFVPDASGKGEALAADIYQNLINVCFFRAGDTVLTASLAQCVFQDIWTANAWLLPPQGAPVTLVFSRQRLDRLPAQLEPLVAQVPPAPADDR